MLANEQYRSIEHMKRDKSKTMTVKEFCQEYNIGMNKGYEIVHAKGFPKITVGRKVLIIRSKIDDWFIENIGSKF